MGTEGVEEEGFFFGSTISWLFSLYQQVTLTARRHNPVDLLIWIDVTVTQSNHLATAALPGERIISAFHVKCALMKVIFLSAAEKCTAVSRRAPLYVFKDG